MRVEGVVMVGVVMMVEVAVRVEVAVMVVGCWRWWW